MKMKINSASWIYVIFSFSEPIHSLEEVRKCLLNRYSNNYGVLSLDSLRECRWLVPFVCQTFSAVLACRSPQREKI